MHTRYARMCLIVAGLASAAAVAYAQGFALRTGQWAFTMSGITGTFGDLSKLPPNVRAQIEARMRQPSNYQSCVTDEDLKDLNLGQQDEDEDCTVKSKKITATTGDVVRECTGDEPHTDTVHYEALTKESMRATIKRVSPAGPAGLTITGKWVGATCKED